MRGYCRHSTARSGFLDARRGATRVETRTRRYASSAVRCRRARASQHCGLFPAGEAGYAGGILSAGVDGIKIAEAVALEHGQTA